MIRRLLLALSCAILLVAGASFGSGVATRLTPQAIAIRDADGRLMAYLTRDGNVLFSNNDGYRAASIDAVTAARLINTLAALPASAAPGGSLRLTLDTQLDGIAFEHPRVTVPADPTLRLLVDTLWRALSLLSGDPTVTPPLLIRLTNTPPAGTFVRLPDGLLDLAAARGDGDRLSGDRLARLLALLPMLSGRQDVSPVVEVAGDRYTLSVVAVPAPEDAAVRTPTP